MPLQISWHHSILSHCWQAPTKDKRDGLMTKKGHTCSFWLMLFFFRGNCPRGRCRRIESNRHGEWNPRDNREHQPPQCQEGSHWNDTTVTPRPNTQNTYWHLLAPYSLSHVAINKLLDYNPQPYWSQGLVQRTLEPGKEGSRGLL